MRVSLLRRGVRVPRYTLIKRTKTSGGGPLDGAELDAIGNDTGIDDGDDGVGRRTVENRCWIWIWRKANVWGDRCGGLLNECLSLWSWKERMKERLIVVEGNACWRTVTGSNCWTIWRKLIQLLVGSHWWKDGGGMLNTIGMDVVWKINTIVKRGGRLRYDYLWDNHYL